MVDGIINILFINITYWWPWLSFWSDTWILQFFILYIFQLLIFNNNLYYILLYLFIEIFYMGLFLSVYQMELFTGFLWVVESTIIFVSILLLFYLNVKGNFNKLSLGLYQYSFYFILLIFMVLPNFNYSETENFLVLPQNLVEFWDNFYEATWNSNTNDFVALKLSYYTFNSAEFLLLGFLLLIGSLICINLFNINKNIKLQQYSNLFSLFNFFKDFIHYIFMRKQNLFYQQRASSSTRIFKKK